MKCSNCSAVCMDTDQTCYSCKQPLRPATSAGSPFPHRIATICACLGAGFGPSIGEAYFPQKPGKDRQTSQIMNAGLGGCVGGTVGLFVAQLFFACLRSKEE